MKADAGRIVWFLGVLGLCYGRSMKLGNITERFCNADYVFKFRVISRLRVDCFPEPTSSPSPSSVVSTQKSSPQTSTSGPDYVISTHGSTVWSNSLRKTIAPTSESTTGEPSVSSNAFTKTAVPVFETTTSQTSTRASPVSSDTLTSTLIPNSETTTSGTSTGEPSISSDALTHTPVPTSETTTDDNNIIPVTSTTSLSSETDKTSSQPTIKQTQPTNGASPRTSSTDEFAVTLEEKLTSQSSTTQTSTKTPASASLTNQSPGGVLTSPIVQERSSSGRPSSPLATDPVTDKKTTSSQNQAPVRRRRCAMPVSHQDIQIMKKHIFKGREDLKQMKRVKDKDAKRYFASIRLDLYVKELKKNKNYFFVGKATPGGNLEDYVFMANELTVTAWRKVRHLKPKLLSNFDDAC